MYFNLHTHQKGAEIYNFRVAFMEKSPPKDQEFSAGIHPWDIDTIEIKKAYQDLEAYLQWSNCVALGELGLDKNCGTDLDLQKRVFQKQIDTALQYQKKVLIIHSVKSYQEIISFKKENDPSLVWILHGFNGGKELITQLLQHGFYFSIGHLLLNPKSKIAHHISNIALERLFLETDESELSIEEIYKEASLKYGIEEKDLIQEVEKNRNRIFSK